MRAIIPDVREGVEECIMFISSMLTNTHHTLASNYLISFTEPRPLAICSQGPTPPPAYRTVPVILDQLTLSRRG